MSLLVRLLLRAGPQAALKQGSLVHVQNGLVEPDGVCGLLQLLCPVFLWLVCLLRKGVLFEHIFYYDSFYPQAKEAGADDILDISKCELSEVNWGGVLAVNLICPFFLDHMSLRKTDVDWGF